jgi:hypothetical protein
MSTTGRTTTEYREAGGRAACFGTVPPYKPNIAKNTLYSEFGGLPVKLRWDKMSNTVAGVLFLSESDVEAIKKMPGFEPCNPTSISCSR